MDNYSFEKKRQTFNKRKWSKFKKDLLEKAKKKPIYKKILETFPDAELIDIEIEEKNNDWFYKNFKQSKRIRSKNERKSGKD